MKSKTKDKRQKLKVEERSDEISHSLIQISYFKEKDFSLLLIYSSDG